MISQIVNKLRQFTGQARSEHQDVAEPDVVLPELAEGSIARENKIVLNIKWSSLLKLASAGINLMLVPVMLRFLGESEYGLWLTISSFLGWSAVLDLGMGLGLRNRLGESLVHGREEDLRTYSSSAYMIISLVSTSAFIIFALLIFYLDWVSILGVEWVSQNRIESILLLFFLFFCVKIVLNQVINIAAAKQNTALNDVVNLLINGLALIFILILSTFSGDRLMAITLIFGTVPVAVLVGISIWAFQGPYKIFNPCKGHVSWTKAKDILKLGSRFFGIQIAGIVIFSTDHLIISHFIGPEAVPAYYISFRYFGLVVMIFWLASNPIWPAYTEAYQKGDLDWIAKINGHMIKLWMLIVLGVAVMFVLAPTVYHFWIGDELIIPWHLSAMMAFYVVIFTWGNIFVIFINSTGKLKMQLLFSLAGGLLNIPLSIYFINHTSLGTAGVMLATIICIAYGPIVAVMQYRKLINGTAKGIWNE